MMNITKLSVKNVQLDYKKAISTDQIPKCINDETFFIPDANNSSILYNVVPFVCRININNKIEYSYNESDMNNKTNAKGFVIGLIKIDERIKKDMPIIEYIRLILEMDAKNYNGFDFAGYFSNDEFKKSVFEFGNEKRPNTWSDKITTRNHSFILINYVVIDSDNIKNNF